MHDFILAKRIIDQILDIVQKKDLNKIKEVYLEIGAVELSHNNLEKHTEEINLDNLKFGIENISKNTILKNTKFEIKKIGGKNWKIKSIEV